MFMIVFIYFFLLLDFFKVKDKFVKGLILYNFGNLDFDGFVNVFISEGLRNLIIFIEMLFSNC